MAARRNALILAAAWLASCGVLTDDGKYHLFDQVADGAKEDRPRGPAAPGLLQDASATVRDDGSAPSGHGNDDASSTALDAISSDETSGLDGERDVSAGGEASDGGAPEQDGGGEDAPATAPCAPDPPPLLLSYYTQDAVVTATATIQFNLRLTSASASNVALSDVRLRYWFSAEGNALSTLCFSSYSSRNGNTDITDLVAATFGASMPVNVTAASDSFIEVSFRAGAGILAGSPIGVATVLVAFQGCDYLDLFNETNDYSFDATKNQAVGYQPSTSVTAYVQDRLVWGCEPGLDRAMPPLGSR